MAAIDNWRNAATQIAQQKKNDYINANQSVLNSINSQKDAELQGLANSNQQAINTLNQNKDKVAETALDNAKQANINRLLALKDNRGAMSRAGLNSQGVVGSQVNSINNNYGTNLNTILKDKATGLRDIEKQVNDTNLQYETNKSNLAAQYAQMYANKQSEIEGTALQLAETAYNNYIAQQQAEAQREQQRLEAERANQLAWAQLNASKSSSGGSYSFGDSGGYEVNTDYWHGDLNQDVKYGTFATTDKNGVRYQPNNINGKKLKSSGKTAGQMFGKNAINSSGVNIANQTVWKLNNKYYIWNGSKNEYERVG